MTSGFDAALSTAVPDLPAETRARLARYGELLAARNVTLNLTAARTPDAFADHVRDSVTLVEFARTPLVDIGSGGGFPALPLAIVTGAHVTLIESVAKKARFLQETVDTLAVAAYVIVERAEDAARRLDLRETFASATARAVGSAPTVLELTVPFLAVGGVAILQRGPFDAADRQATSDAALVLGAELVEERVDLHDSDRRVLLVRKVRPTQQRFPRRAGIPAKRPLCDTSR